MILFLLSGVILSAKPLIKIPKHNSCIGVDTTDSQDSTQADSLNNNVVQKDTSVTPAPKGITADSVIDTYINSIGGRENIRKVTDRLTIMHGKIQRVSVTMLIYQKVPDKLKQVIKAGGSKQQIYFDGENGFMVLNDKKIDITGSELEKLKYESTMALLLDLKYYKINLKLDGIAKVDSIDTYKIEMILPSGHVWIQYYDINSGLKVKESKYVTVPQGTFIQDSYYSDYRNVDGIKYPFTIREDVGAQRLDFKVTSIKINTGLIDREFEYKEEN